MYWAYDKGNDEYLATPEIRAEDANRGRID